LFSGAGNVLVVVIGKITGVFKVDERRDDFDRLFMFFIESRNAKRHFVPDLFGFHCFPL
jgi:hypothetical protein